MVWIIATGGAACGCPSTNAEEKARCSDLHTIQLLHPIMKHLPLAVTKAVAKAGFHSPEISYTNLGKIDAASIYFNDCTIRCIFWVEPAYTRPSDISLYMEGYLYLACHVTGRHVTANACTENSYNHVDCCIHMPDNLNQNRMTSAILFSICNYVSTSLFHTRSAM